MPGMECDLTGSRQVVPYAGDGGTDAHVVECKVLSTHHFVIFQPFKEMEHLVVCSIRGKDADGKVEPEVGGVGSLIRLVVNLKAIGGSNMNMRAFR